jgi:uncharacterized protein YxjI
LGIETELGSKWAAGLFFSSSILMRDLMLNKILISLIALCFSTFLAAELPYPLPNQFKITQRWLSLTNDFDVETEQYKFGYVHRELLSLTLNYGFYDIYDHLEARAVARFFSLGFTFDVFDDLGQPLGIVQEKVLSFYPTFDILSPTGEILANATTNFWGTEFVLTDPITHQPMVTLTRSFFRLKDDWNVSITNPSLFYQRHIDPRLFILVVVFQSDWELIMQIQQQEDSRHQRGLLE